MSKSAIVFSMKSCGPCKVYKQVAVDPMIADGYDIQVVDVEEDQELAMQYKVRAVPTTIIMEDNVYSESCTGSRSLAELTKLLT